MVEPSMEKLIAMKLSGMAEGLKEQMQNPAYRDLSFEERLEILIDKEKLHRENRQLKILLSHAHFRHSTACCEDIDFRTRRGIAKDMILKLSQNEWIDHHQNVIIVGPTGVGKTYLACALGNSAIRQGDKYHLCEAATVNTGTKNRTGRRELCKTPPAPPEDKAPHYR